MKKFLLFTFFVAAFAYISNAQTETVLFSDNFDSYAIGTDITTITADGAAAPYAYNRVDAGVVDAGGNTSQGVKLTHQANTKRGFFKVSIDPALFIVKGYSYRLNADFKTPSSTAALYVGVEFIDGDGDKYRTNSETRDEGSGWVSDVIEFSPDTVIFDVNSEITALNLYVWIGADPTAVAFDCYIDNVVFTRIGDGATKINNNKASELKLYPNPSTGSFHLNSEKLITGYTVYNTAGQVVKQVNSLSGVSTKVDLSGADKGLYYIKVNNNSGESQVVKALVK